LRFSYKILLPLLHCYDYDLHDRHLLHAPLTIHPHYDHGDDDDVRVLLPLHDDGGDVNDHVLHDRHLLHVPLTIHLHYDHGDDHVPFHLHDDGGDDYVLLPLHDDGGDVNDHVLHDYDHGDDYVLYGYDRDRLHVHVTIHLHDDGGDAQVFLHDLHDYKQQLLKKLIK
jgi:hypothetical protein